jgi:hypothetical protein
MDSILEFSLGVIVEAAIIAAHEFAALRLCHIGMTTLADTLGRHNVLGVNLPKHLPRDTPVRSRTIEVRGTVLLLGERENFSFDLSGAGAIVRYKRGTQ